MGRYRLPEDAFLPTRSRTELRDLLSLLAVILSQSISLPFLYKGLQKPEGVTAVMYMET